MVFVGELLLFGFFKTKWLNKWSNQWLYNVTLGKMRLFTNYNIHKSQNSINEFLNWVKRPKNINVLKISSKLKNLSYNKQKNLKIH